MDQGNREAPGKITRRLACFTVALAGLFLTLTSCLQTVPGDLTDNERLWQSQNISNYDFVLERQCFCPEDWRGPVKIEVRGGKAVSMTYVSNRQPAGEDKFGNVNTIDKLFQVASDAYTGENTFNQKADTVKVTYHAQKGYPLTIYIDVSAAIADEEQGYTVEELVVR